MKVRLLVLVIACLFIYNSAKADSGCLSCHAGIEDINSKMTNYFKTSLDMKPGYECILCHNGDANAAKKEDAHKGMIVNPSDLAVAGQTCGACHMEFVEKVSRSLMANSQGEIAGALYARGYSKNRDERFAMDTQSVIKMDNAPGGKGAVDKLEPIPDSSAHLSVEMLRKACIKCHLKSDGIKAAKSYHAAGCAACHMTTSADGKYTGSDPTMKGKEWRSSVHKITTKIPSEQCVRCHKGGNRIGVSYIAELPGHEADIHYKKGMDCIDCHTENEIHGDGNIYLRKWQAVKIRCTSCHGTPSDKPTLSDLNGKALNNVRQEGDKYVLKSKVSGAEHVIPALSQIMSKGELSLAMSIKGHMDKMECAACHATKNVSCYGCHFKVDRSKMGKDVITGKETPGAWSIVTEDSTAKWKRPPLSVHQTRKAAPNQLGCAVHITEIDKDGHTVMDYAVNPANEGKTLDGYTAYSRVSLGNAHTNQRSDIAKCDDCHKNPAALGLGGSVQETFKSGKPFKVDPDRYVDENGKQILAFSQIGQRPFNSDELKRIKRVGECTGCHVAPSNATFWNNFEKNYSWVIKNKGEHEKKIAKSK